MKPQDLDLLIVGGESDPNTQRIVDQAHMLGVDYRFWDTDLPGCRQVAWDFESPLIDLGDQQFSPRSIFLRWNVFGGDPAANLAVHETVQGFAFAWPQVRILNRSSIADINNKCFNLRLAQEIGFSIPDSLVMSDLQPLLSMPDPESRIAKPLEGGGHAKRVSELIQSPESIAEATPQFIQEEIGGENLRVFSTGGDLTCFQLVTSKLDYREDDHVDVVQVDVPKQLVEPTHKLVEAKGFDYCALDFRCREGTHNPVFLEVNSFPMFVRFDDAGNNCIVNAMLQFLLGNRSASRTGDLAQGAPSLV